MCRKVDQTAKKKYKDELKIISEAKNIDDIFNSLSIDELEEFLEEI